MLTTKLVVCPLQIVAVPLNTADVIAALTVTGTGVPRLVAIHVLASVNAVTEYVPAGAVGIVKVVVG